MSKDIRCIGPKGRIIWLPEHVAKNAAFLEKRGIRIAEVATLPANEPLIPVAPPVVDPPTEATPPVVDPPAESTPPVGDAGADAQSTAVHDRTTKFMEELADLKELKASRAETDSREQTTDAAPASASEKSIDIHYKQAIAHLETFTTVEQIKAYTEGDNRPALNKAAQARINQLSTNAN